MKIEELMQQIDAKITEKLEKINMLEEKIDNLQSNSQSSVLIERINKLEQEIVNLKEEKNKIIEENKNGTNKRKRNDKHDDDEDEDYSSIDIDGEW